MRDIFGDRDSVTYTDDEKVCRDVDMFISVGGDGSFINAAKKATVYNKPVICVNAGKIAYLACLEGDEIHLLEEIVGGRYVTEKRMMLHVSIENDSGEDIYSTDCINDAVVSRSGSIRIMKLTVGCNGAPLIAYMSDGAIISTPTGSTAYCMSAGGPIIDPGLDCICAVPVCPYMSLNNGAVVFSASSVIEVEFKADKINEAFADNFGDIILEDLGDGYAVISDYREDVKKWLTKITK
jgi:NAD+ kinase